MTARQHAAPDAPYPCSVCRRPYSGVWTDVGYRAGACHGGCRPPTHTPYCSCPARINERLGTAMSAFARPKSLYIEATGIRDDGSEFVIKMRLEPATTDDSLLTLDMENLAVEDLSNWLYTRQMPTGEHNVRIEFTRCRLGDPEPLADGAS